MPTYFVSDYEFSRAHGIPLKDVSAAKKRLEKEGEKLAVSYDPADYAADEDEPDDAADEDEPDDAGDARKAVRTKVVRKAETE